MAEPLTTPLRLKPRYHDRIWGGTRLLGRAGVGESWLAGEQNVVEGGPHEGRTLGELAEEHPEALIGAGASASNGFPLLIKLLDTADWLSVQVHPDDDLALALEGPGTRGKTEAWHVLEANAGAEALLGAQVGREEFDTAIGTAQLPESLGRYPLKPGGTIFVPAGAPHALGPGSLVYEIQQHSDITYRGYDWNRDRGPLQLENFRRASDVDILSRNFVVEPPALDVEPVLMCDHFMLDRRNGGFESARRSATATFEIVTVVRGTGTLRSAGATLSLAPYDTVVIPAACDSYSLELDPGGEALFASPGGTREIARRLPHGSG